MSDTVGADSQVQKRFRRQQTRLLAVTGLSISSLPKYVALWPKARAVGAEGIWWETVALSILNNLATASGAHLVGVITHWIWW